MSISSGHAGSQAPHIRQLSTESASSTGTRPALQGARDRVG